MLKYADRYLTWLQTLDGQRTLMSHAFAGAGRTNKWGATSARAIIQGSAISYSHVRDPSSAG